MKQSLFFLVCLSLLWAWTGSCPAETKVEFKGHYRVRYIHLDNFGLGTGYPVKDGANNLQADHRAYFDQRFRIEPRFIVSDCLELRMRIHALYYNRWGSAPSVGKGNGVGYHPWDETGRAESEFVLSRVYGVIKTGWGTFSIGRQQIGVAGLNKLGFTGGRFAKAAEALTVGPFDLDYNGHRIGWQNQWGHFSLSLIYQKDDERDSGNQGAQAMNAAPTGSPVGAPGNASSPGYDDDQDQFWILPQYEWKNGGANLLFAYLRGRSWNEQGGPGYDPLVWNTPLHNNPFNGGTRGIRTVASDWDAFMLNPALALNFGPWAFHGEFACMWGEFRPDRQIYPDENIMPDVKAGGWGLWLDGAYNYGRGEVGAMFSYLGGRNFNDTDADDPIRGILGIGDLEAHSVFLVAYDRAFFNTMALMNTGPFTRLGYNYSTWNNHWMIGAYNSFNLTQDILAHTSLGYFQLVNVPDIAGLDFKKDLGVELDAGIAANIMDGLVFSSVFGYFWTGRAWKYGVDAVDLGNTWAWKNQLVLSF